MKEYQNRWTDPDEIKEWRLCIMLGGVVYPDDPATAYPKDPNKFCHFEGTKDWLYRDGYQGTEEEARIEVLAWLDRKVKETGYTGPATYEFFPWSAEDERKAKEDDQRSRGSVV